MRIAAQLRAGNTDEALQVCCVSSVFSLFRAQQRAIITEEALQNELFPEIWLFVGPFCPAAQLGTGNTDEAPHAVSLLSVCMQFFRFFLHMCVQYLCMHASLSLDIAASLTLAVSRSPNSRTRSTCSLSFTQVTRRASTSNVAACKYINPHPANTAKSECAHAPDDQDALLDSCEHSEHTSAVEGSRGQGGFGGGGGGGGSEMRDCGSSLVSTGEYWQELPSEEQGHWRTLGWDAASWSKPPPLTTPHTLPGLPHDCI